MFRRFILSVTLVALPLVSAEAGNPRLDTDAVRALLTGNTMDAITALKRFKGKVFHVHMKAGGTLTIRNFDGSTDTGVWEVTGDGFYCNQYSQTRKNMRKCFSVHRVAEERYELRTQKGTLSSTFAVRKGNPDNL